MNSRAERVRAIIAEKLCDTMPPSAETIRTIYPDDRNLAALGVDSLDRAEIGMALEEEFPGLDVQGPDLDAWSTVGDVIRYIADRTEVVS